MTEVGIVLNVDDSKLVAALQKEIKLLTKLKNEADKTGKELDTAFQDGAKDVEKFNKELEKTSKSAGNISNAFGGLSGKIGAALTIGALTAFGKELFDTAVEMERLEAKAVLVFGDALPAVAAAAEETANALGLTTTEFVNVAAATQDLLVPMGFTRDTAAALSVEVTNLSGALSLWDSRGRTVVEVQNAIESALIKNFESVRSMGIIISDEIIQEKLWEKGLNKLTGTTRKQAEAAVILEEITRQSADAVQSAADSTESLAIKQKQLAASFTDIKNNIARELIPVFADLFQQVDPNRLTRAFRLSIAQIRGFFAGVGQVIENVSKGFDVFALRVQLFEAQAERVAKTALFRDTTKEEADIVRLRDSLAQLRQEQADDPSLSIAEAARKAYEESLDAANRYNGAIIDLGAQNPLAGLKDGVTATTKEIKEAEKAAEKADKALASFLSKLTGDAQDANIDSLDPEAKAARIQEVTLLQIAELEKQATELAKAAGKEIDITEEITELKLEAEREYQETIAEIRSEEFEISKKARAEDFEDYLQTLKKKANLANQGIETTDSGINTLGTTELNSDGIVVPINYDEREAEREGVFARIKERNDEFLDELSSDETLSPLDRIKSKLAEALGIDDEQLGAIVSSFSNTLSSLADTAKNNIDTQLKIQTDALDELIDKRQESLDTLKDQLKDEQAEKDAGRANDVDNIEKQIKKENEAIEKAEAEKLALKKDALKQQLAIDSAAQISAAAVGAVQLFAGFQSIPLGLGLLAGAAALASFFALIKSIQSQAQAINALHTGGHLADHGLVNRNGRTDKYGGKGHRIQDSNIIVGGKEFIHKEEVSMKQLDFFNKLNNDEYGNVDMNQVMREYFEFKSGDGFKTDIRTMIVPGPSIGNVVNRFEKVSEGRTDKEKLTVSAMAKIIEKQTKQLEALESGKVAATPFYDANGKFGGVIKQQGNRTTVEHVS